MQSFSKIVKSRSHDNKNCLAIYYDVFGRYMKEANIKQRPETTSTTMKQMFLQRKANRLPSMGMTQAARYFVNNETVKVRSPHIYFGCFSEKDQKRLESGKTPKPK